MKEPKKMLENSFVGSLMVPIAIVLVGAMIVLGVTKMLSTDRTYKDLLNEMESKRFGNRWIAAYELSKQISSSKIKESKEDVSYIIGRLSSIYDSSVDPRSRSFIIVTVGALKSAESVPILIRALKEEDGATKFHAVTSIGNLPVGTSFPWDDLSKLLDSDDITLKHATILSLATHKVAKFVPNFVSFLSNQESSIRYASATALINFKHIAAREVLEEILLLEYPKPTAPGKFNPEQIKNLKLGVLKMLAKNQWTILDDVLEKVAERDENLTIKSEAKRLLIK